MYDTFHLMFALAVFVGFAYVCFILFTVIGARSVVRTDSPERAPMPSDDSPGVSILKPCAGNDDDLESCLESYCALRYPRMQLVFGVRDTTDAAYPIIERVKARHPELDIAVVLSGEGRHPSPKVVNLAAMAPLAKYELFWLSDSNTRVHPDTLIGLVAEMQGPRVGAVVSPLVGDEEKTFGAAVENLQLNAFMGTTGYACWLVTRIVTLAGKSVLIRRTTIEAFGGWDELGRYAGEDVMLFTRVKELGLRVVLGRHAVRNVAQRITLARCAARHMRWAQIRWRTVTPTTILEPLLSPLLMSVVFALVEPGQTALAMMAAGFTLQTVGDLVGLRAQRGHTIALAYLPAIWLRPFLGIWVWARGLTSARFEWRGHAFWMGPSSTILTEPPMRARLRAMRERSA